MAAALFRRGSGLCLRCIHRELCRVVWRPQAALFSSKPSDRKLPRRTHIKKAKSQPAVDVAQLLEQLFSQRRPGTAPPAAGTARPAKASSTPSKPPTTSSVTVSTSSAPLLSKTEPAVSVFPAASGVSKNTTSTFNATTVEPSPNPQTSFSSETQLPRDVIQDITADGAPATSASPPTSTTPPSPGSEAATVENQTSAETRETKVETGTETDEPVLPLSAHMVVENVEKPSVPAAKVEPSTETTTEPSVDAGLPPVEALETRSSVVEGPVESVIDVTVDTAAQKVQIISTDSDVVDASYGSTVEPSIETTVEPSADTSVTPLETLESIAAVAECPVEPTVESEADEGVVNISYDAKEPLMETTIKSPAETSSPVEALETRGIEEIRVENIDLEAVNISHTSTVEPLVETAVDPPVEASPPTVEAQETRVSVEGPVASTLDATADVPTEEIQAKSTDLGDVNISHNATVEPVLETTIDPSVEAGPAGEALETCVAEAAAETLMEANAAQTVQTSSHTATIEPLLESTVEPPVEAIVSPQQSQAAVVEGTVEPAIETEGADNFSHAALIQNTHESAMLPLKDEVEPTESIVESSSGNDAAEKGTNESEQMTLESVTLHLVKGSVESLETDELLQTKFILDEKAEEQLQEQEQTGIRAEHKAENSGEDESETLTKALSQWDTLSEDLREFEGEAGTLVKELLFHVPAVLPSSPAPVKTSSDSLQLEETAAEEEAMTLESVTLAEVKAEVGGLETEILQETSRALEKEADVRAKEEKVEVKMEVEDDVFEDTTEAHILNLDAIAEATDAIETEASVMLEAMFGSEQGPRQPPDALLLKPQDETMAREVEKESAEQEGSVLEAMSLESVTLAEVEASLGTLENEPLSEATAFLESEAEILAGEARMEAEEVTASEEMPEALNDEPPSLLEADGLSEDLQTDALMEELLFTVPGHLGGVREAQVGQEVGSADILDVVDTEAAETGDFPVSPAPEELLSGQEMVEEGAQGDEEGTGTHTDLDPVQRLFLEKIREYNTMHRLNGRPVEAEPDYERHLSEETAKLQRLYGGGDLSSFPRFTFTEPKMDQDSK